MRKLIWIKRLIIIPIFISISSADLNAVSMSDLISKFRRELDLPDSTQGYYSNAEIRFEINDGIEYACRKGIGVIKEGKIAIVHGQQNYTVPSDFIEALNVQIKVSYVDTTYGVRQTIWSWFGLRSTEEKTLAINPYEVSYFDTLISFSPIPRSGDSIVLKYSALPARITGDSTTVTLDVDLRLIAVDYAIAQALKKDREYSAYKSMLTDCEERALKHREAQKIENVPSKLEGFEK